MTTQNVEQKHTVSENSEMPPLVRLLRLVGTSGGTLLFRLVFPGDSSAPKEFPLAIPLGGSAGGALLLLLTPPAFTELPGAGAGGCLLWPFILWGRSGELVAS